MSEDGAGFQDVSEEEGGAEPASPAAAPAAVAAGPAATAFAPVGSVEGVDDWVTDLLDRLASGSKLTAADSARVPYATQQAAGLVVLERAAVAAVAARPYGPDRHAVGVERRADCAFDGDLYYALHPNDEVVICSSPPAAAAATRKQPTEPADGYRCGDISYQYGPPICITDPATAPRHQRGAHPFQRLCSSLRIDLDLDPTRDKRAAA